jgi:Family of unknown function (DUF6612)
MRRTASHRSGALGGSSMKKLLFAVLVALMVASLAVAGCGKKDSGSPTSANGILTRSQKAVQGVKSFKVSGSVDLKTPGAEEKESKDTFTGEFNVISSSDVEGHLVAQNEKGQESQAYIQGDYVYTYSASSGWEKQKVQNVKDLGVGMITPGNLTALTKYAQNVKKLPDEGNNFVISFDVGSKFFENTLNAVDQQASSAPSSSEQSMAQGLSDLYKSVAAGIKMNVVMKVDKTTYLPSEVTVTASAKGIPVMGDISMESKVAFSDYNQPVTVTLPPEAASAKEKPPGLPSGVPSLPGLGL